MKIQFQVEYQTPFGEELVLNILPEENSGKVKQFKMTTHDGMHWECEIKKAAINRTFIDYYYSVYNGDQEMRHEWLTEPHRLEFASAKGTNYKVYDHWLDIPEDSFMYSSAFTDCVMARKRELCGETDFSTTIRLKVRAPQLRSKDRLALIGNGSYLGDWNTQKPLTMTEHECHEWVINLDASKLTDSFEFKFIVVNKERGVPMWEQGENRTILLPKLEAGEVVIYELSQAYFPIHAWRGAGTVVPVFSLRSEGSFGVGDFGDLKQMIDWCALTHQRILQILPINDTNMTFTWQDSYPYNSISIYALHPQYTDLRQLPAIKDPEKQQAFEQLRQSWLTCAKSMLRRARR